MSKSLSVVVEWENARNSEHSRASIMLRNLVKQLREVEGEFTASAEIILIHDDLDTSASDVISGMGRHLADSNFRVSSVAVQGMNYYQQKNFGARKSKSDLILLVDSDVIPEDGWLRSLLSCQRQEDADVVCGSTHIETTSTYSKAFALFWFFPLPGESVARRRAERFFANNVLFKGSVLRENPFPDLPFVRGQCAALAKQLLSCGKSIYLEPEGRVRHPAPNGFRHFVYRALCEGHDNVHSLEVKGVTASFKKMKWTITSACRRILEKRTQVHLSTPGAVAAIFVAVAYRGIEFFGELITLANARLIGDHLRV